MLYNWYINVSFFLTKQQNVYLQIWPMLILTFSTIFTEIRIRCTFINIILAGVPCEPQSTRARETRAKWCTCSSITTWLCYTVICYFTVLPWKYINNNIRAFRTYNIKRAVVVLNSAHSCTRNDFSTAFCHVNKLVTTKLIILVYCACRFPQKNFHILIKKREVTEIWSLQRTKLVRADPLLYHSIQFMENWKMMEFWDIHTIFFSNRYS